VTIEEQNGKERGKEVGSCFHYKKSEHLIRECPTLKATSSSRVPKNKAMKATWDDDSESDSSEDVDTANVCFMAHGDDPTNISLEASVDNNDLIIDELANFFEELQERYDLLKVQNNNWKKKWGFA